MKPFFVPKFETTEEMDRWLQNVLPPGVPVNRVIFDPETGEIIMDKGQTLEDLEERTRREMERLARKREKDLPEDDPDYDWRYDSDEPEEYRFGEGDSAPSGSSRFDNNYDVEYSTVAEDLADYDAEEIGYDPSAMVPQEIKRKDGGKFTDLDLKNIKAFINDWNRASGRYNYIKLTWGWPQEGDDVAFLIGEYLL